jgi:hypothetical protein
MNTYRTNQDLLAEFVERQALLAKLEVERQQLLSKISGLVKDTNALEKNAAFLENRLRSMRYNENDIMLTTDRIERSFHHCIERNQEMQERHVRRELVDYFQMDAAMRQRVHAELMAYKKLIY